MAILSSKLATRLLVFVAAGALPFLFWAALALVVRHRPERLGRIYPWLKAAAWISWSAAIVAIGFTLVRDNLHSIVWPCVVAFSSGVQLVHGWARRKVEGKSAQESADGWWPTPKKF